MSSSSSRDDVQPARDSKGRKGDSISSWVPVSMLAVTTAALAVPVALLIRRNRANGLARAAPPPRRTSDSTIPYAPRPPAITPSSGATLKSSPPSISAVPRNSKSSPTNASAISANSDPIAITFLGFGAFAIATLLVAGGSIATIFTLKSSWDVHTMEDFARRMRQAMASLPIVKQINREPLPSDEIPPASLSSPFNPPSESGPGRTILDPPPTDAVEARLRAAWNEGGLSKWAEVAWKELEADLQARRKEKEAKAELRSSNISAN